MAENVTLEFVESQAETVTETGFPAAFRRLYVCPICGTFVPDLGEHGLGLRLGDGLRDGDGDGLGLTGDPCGDGDGDGLGLGTVLGELDEPPGLGLRDGDGLGTVLGALDEPPGDGLGLLDVVVT